MQLTTLLLKNQMSNQKCPTDGCDLKFVSKDSVTKRCYDYKETTTYYYYKCEECGRMYDERVKQTTLRHLALANYAKAEKMAKPVA